MEPHFTCTTIETQRDFLEVGYKISFMKNAMWTAAEIAGGIACVVAASRGVGNYLLPCGLVLLVMGVGSSVWPWMRAVLGYRKALKTYGGQMKPSYVTFADKIINETPNGTMTVPYDKVKTIHFLKDAFVIEDDRGAGVLVSKNGFTKGEYMDCVNFLCEQCSNMEL